MKGEREGGREKTRKIEREGGREGVDKGERKEERGRKIYINFSYTHRETKESKRR